MRQQRSELSPGTLQHLPNSFSKCDYNSILPDILDSIRSGKDKINRLSYSFLFFFFSLLMIFIFCYSWFTGFCQFLHTAKWPSHTHTYFLFLTLSPITFHQKWLDIVPCATQQDLIAYSLQMQSLHLLTPDSQSSSFLVILFLFFFPHKLRQLYI